METINRKMTENKTIAHKTTVLLSTIGLLALAVLLAGCTGFIKDPETINVAGHAEMTVEPDQAKVYTGVSVLKPTAAEAQSDANKIIGAIVDGLRYKGISESDIETDNLNLYEEKQWIEKESQTQTVGWRATQTLRIKTSDLSKVGEIVDIAVTNGANQIDSIEFYLSTGKDEDSRQEVLAKATQNAKDKAETMADNLGVKLDKIQSASESNYGYAPYRYMMANSVGMDAVRESADVLPSDVIVSADMALVYAIRQD